MVIVISMSVGSVRFKIRFRFRFKVRFGRELSCPVLLCPVLSCPVLSCPVLSCPVSLPILFPARFSLQVVTTRMVSMRGPPYAVSSFAKKAYWLNSHTMCEPTEWEDSGESITPNQHA